MGMSYSDERAVGNSVGNASTQQRVIEGLLDVQEKHIMLMTELMRRVEELVDRLGGAQPSTVGDDKDVVEHPGVAGYLGALHGQQIDREKITTRTADALSRIERLV